jgi:hemerythrin
MAQSQWQPGMGAGFEALEADHRHLIALLNRLRDRIAADDDPAIIQALLDDVVHYAGYYFRREEAAMRRLGYPRLAAHHRLHEAIAARLAMFHSAYHWSPEDFDMAEFSEFLTDWLLAHVLCEDLQLQPFAEDHGAVHAV